MNDVKFGMFEFIYLYFKIGCVIFWKEELCDNVVDLYMFG